MLCAQLGMSGENCLIFNWHGSSAAPGISFFTVPTKDDEYSINWRNKIVAVTTRDRWSEGNLKDKLKTDYFELHYPQDKMIYHFIFTKQRFSLY